MKRPKSRSKKQMNAEMAYLKALRDANERDKTDGLTVEERFKRWIVETPPK